MTESKKKVECKDCRFYAQRIDYPTNGYCRKLPPVLSNKFNFGAWPIVNAADWCGEFRGKDDAEESTSERWRKLVEKANEGEKQ